MVPPISSTEPTDIDCPDRVGLNVGLNISLKEPVGMVRLQKIHLFVVLINFFILTVVLTIFPILRFACVDVM